MRKALTLILVLGIVVIAAAPFGFGFWAEARMGVLLEKMSDSGVIDVTVLKTDRGWFSTESELVVELTGDAGEAYRKYQEKSKATEIKSASIRIQNKIYHGPFPISMFSGNGFSIMPVIGKVDTKPLSDSGEPLFADISYKLTTTFDVTGTAKTALDIPEWNGPVDGGKSNISWKGLIGVISYNADLDPIGSNFKAPEFSVTGEKGGFRINGISAESELSKGLHGLSLGDASFSVDSMEASPSAVTNKPAFSLADVSVKASSYAEGENVNSAIEIGMSKLMVGDRSFGPGAFKLSLRNLDAESMAKINNEIKQLQKQGIPQDQLGMMLGVKMFALLPTILKKGPELEIPELSLDSDFGKVSGKGKIGFDTSNETALANPLLLAGAVIANAEFSIPEEFLVAIEMNSVKKNVAALGLDYTDEQIMSEAKNRIKQKMSAPAAQKFFILNDGIYSFVASYVGGLLTVNGQNMPLTGLVAK